MTWPAITTLALVAVYLVISYWRFGWTYSISDTRYEWLKFNYSEAFTLFSLILSIGAFVQMANPWSHEFKGFTFAAGVAMLGVPIASIYKDDKMVARIHYTLSAFAVAFSLLAITCQDWPKLGWLWIPLWLTLVALTRKYWPANIIYKVEVYAIVIYFGRAAWI